MLENVNLAQITQQYILQMGFFYLADIQEQMNAATCLQDENAIYQSLADFKSGFDRRHQLMTLNHILRKFF